MTRAPLLNHVDLRMFYVPVGETPFEDERIDYPGKHYGITNRRFVRCTFKFYVLLLNQTCILLAEPSNFDLQIGEMLGAVDPRYQSSVTMTFNNLLRVCPKVS